MTDIQANDVATEIAAIGEAIPPEDLAIVPKDLSRIVKDPLERIAELERALSATAKYAGRLSDLNSALMLGGDPTMVERLIQGAEKLTAERDEARADCRYLVSVIQQHWLKIIRGMSFDGYIHLQHRIESCEKKHRQVMKNCTVIEETPQESE